MKILAVSDKESTRLIHWIETSPEDLREVDLIVSCGDLPASYLEFLSHRLDKEVVCVRGNHDPRRGWKQEAEEEPHTFLEIPMYHQDLHSLQDIHGQLFVFKDWVLMGFEGCLWYNGKGPQYSENDMAKIVRNSELKFGIQRFVDWFKGKKHKLMIVSHAPPFGIHDDADLCHRGFQCFRHLMDDLTPTLWLHGHTAYENIVDNQISIYQKTSILNTYEYRFIVLSENQPPVISTQPSILKKE